MRAGKHTVAETDGFETAFSSWTVVGLGVSVCSPLLPCDQHAEKEREGNLPLVLLLSLEDLYRPHEFVCERTGRFGSQHPLSNFLALCSLARAAWFEFDSADSAQQCMMCALVFPPSSRFCAQTRRDDASDLHEIGLYSCCFKQEGYKSGIWGDHDANVIKTVYEALAFCLSIFPPPPPSIHLMPCPFFLPRSSSYCDCKDKKRHGNSRRRGRCVSVCGYFIFMPISIRSVHISLGKSTSVELSFPTTTSGGKDIIV